MPSVSRFFGITIYMYKKDHNLPHFHAVYNEYDCIVDINQAKAKGKFPKDKKKVVEAWAVIHRQELLDNWDLLCRENKVLQIEPLQ